MCLKQHHVEGSQHAKAYRYRSSIVQAIAQRMCAKATSCRRLKTCEAIAQRMRSRAASCQKLKCRHSRSEDALKGSIVSKAQSVRKHRANRSSIVRAVAQRMCAKAGSCRKPKCRDSRSEDALKAASCRKLKAYESITLS
jgi:hypothetical protein